MPPPPNVKKRLLFLVAGFVLGAIGLLVGLLEAIALVDPTGTKMADDSDPFGDPYISISQHIFFIVLTLSLFAIAGWLLHRSDKDLVPK